MNILHLSNSDRKGAYEAAIRLHKAFLANGHNSVVAVRYKTIPDDDTIIQCPSSVPIMVQKAYDIFIQLIRKNPDYYFFNSLETVSFFSAKKIVSLLPFCPDIIICHWISKFINTKVISELQRITGAKILWHFLDMAPMTGGCHYAWNCTGYQKKCGMCPAIYSHRKKDISSINFSIKRQYVEKIKPIIITPTDELYTQCQKSTLFKKRKIYKILLPMDTTIFFPGNKKQLRMKYKIPTKSKVICIRSDNPQQKRKGFHYIINCFSILQKLSIRNIHIAIVGQINKNDHEKIPFPYTVFSSFFTAKDLADVYRLSDVLLSASIQDSGPMMVNEAMASGLPVISFPIGVSKDLIFNGKTGYITKLENPSDFADKLRIILSLKAHTYQKMSRNCRKLALEKLNYSKVIKQYKQFF